VSDISYAELLRCNRELAGTLQGKGLRIAVLSNVVVAQLKEILEYTLRSRGVNAHVDLGDYDNVVQDCARFARHDGVVLFWESCNFVDGLHYRAALMAEDELTALRERLVGEIDLALKALLQTRLVLFNRFSSLLFNCYELREGALDRLCRELNQRFDERSPTHVLAVDVDKVIAQVSVAKSVDWRSFHSARAPYSVDFFRAYANYVAPALLSMAGRAKKALIFDCDNTLWEGILGEDGEEGIALSAETRQGRPFAEVQALAHGLGREGVILGLCSKNNPEDVDRVFEAYPDTGLRESDLAIKRVNWSDKVTNLRDIAETLNLGLDALVFVDDSDFEIGLVREKLPEVATLHVPAARYDYPALMRRWRNLFFTLSRSAEDTAKTRMYREEAQRQQAAKSFTSIEDYLRSLGLTLTLHVNDASLTARMAQLTQKTNQFNLTTRRYTEADLHRMLEDGAHCVLAFRVTDRFGDYGITGLVIVERKPQTQHARIDSFLMSCRVLGRNVERALFDTLVADLAVEGVRVLEAEYLRTPKNSQVEELFDRFGLELTDSSRQHRRYQLNVAAYAPASIDYIEIVRR